MMKWWLAGFAVWLWQAQQQLPPDLMLLTKIKVNVAENLKRLPNYTCTETIERSTRLKNSSKAQVFDTVRLEVAYVQGKELFGWPGAARIDEPEISKLVAGSIGNGYFALFSKNIFAQPSVTFHFTGSAELAAKPAFRWDYRVPREAKTYSLRTPLGEAYVGYHGSFWVDGGTLDLARVDVTVDDPPLVLGIDSSTSVLDFARIAIGNSTFVLPQSAEHVITDSDATVHRNRLSFRSCHEFAGESVVRYDESALAPVAVPAQPPIHVVNLPRDFFVHFSLEAPIDSATAASGDIVQATLADNIKLNHEIVVPKGARLSGRIAHLTNNSRYFRIQFTFASLDFEGGHADLGGRRNIVSQNDRPLIFRTDHLMFRRGARLRLHSLLLKFEEHDSIRP